MGGVLDVRVQSAAAAAFVSCLIAVGGCGGGDDASSTRTTGSSADIPLVTAPTGTTTPKRQEPPPDAAGAPTSVPPDSAPATGARIRAVMAPFYACLEQQGVRPAPLNGTGLRGDEIRNARLVHEEIQARLACLQKLPPQFKAAGEQFRRRFGR